MSLAPADRATPPPLGEVQPFQFPRFERIALSPGLELLAAPSDSTPLTFLDLISPGGARFDPPGHAGLAALTASMLDEGTRERTALEIATVAERLGGYLSTGTGWNVTSLGVGLLSRHLRTGLELVAEVFGQPAFPEDELERLRARTLSEFQRRWGLPSFLASHQFASALYGDSVYGQPVLGTSASVEALTGADIGEFYRQRIVASPLTLIATGDFDPAQLATGARELLAGLALAPEPGEETIEPRPETGLRTFIVDRPGAAQTELRMGHIGVPRSHPDFLAITVMNSLLGGKFTSRLVLNLRERHGLTYSIRSGFGRRLGPGPFVVSSAVETNATGRAVDEIRAELERLRDEPVSAEELEETQSYILGVFPYTVQTLEGVGHRLREIAVYGLPDDHWDRYPETIRGVTVDDVQRVAREHLRPDRLAIVAVGPAAELEPQLAHLGTLATWCPSVDASPL